MCVSLTNDLRKGQSLLQAILGLAPVPLTTPASHLAWRSPGWGAADSCDRVTREYQG